MAYAIAEAPAPVDLSAMDKDNSRNGLSTTYTDRETGAWVRIEIDQYAQDLNPAKDIDGVEIAYTGSDSRDYDGTVPGIRWTDDLSVECPVCKGDPEGSTEIRWELHRGPNGEQGCVASGSYDAMQHVLDDIYAREGEDAAVYAYGSCHKCKGEGVAPVSLGEYLRSEYGALAHYESETGGYSQGSSASFVAFVTTDEFTDPQAAAESIAGEYAAWARGDVYLLTAGDSLGEDEDGTTGGFIGTEHAEAEAAQMMSYAIRSVQERREANIVRSDN